MSARTARTRLLAAATVALAAVALTACRNGEGVRDEGPSSASTPDTSARSSGRAAPCSGAHIHTTARQVSRTVDHLLLTVTNTGATNCTLSGYPQVRFDGAPSSPRPVRETKPHTAITLSPGESAYAGVLLSAADGTGTRGHTAKTVTLTLPSGPAVRLTLPAQGVHVTEGPTVTYWLSSEEAALTR